MRVIGPVTTISSPAVSSPSDASVLHPVKTRSPTGTSDAISYGTPSYAVPVRNVPSPATYVTAYSALSCHSAVSVRGPSTSIRWPGLSETSPEVFHETKIQSGSSGTSDVTVYSRPSYAVSSRNVPPSVT